MRIAVSALFALAAAACSDPPPPEPPPTGQGVGAIGAPALPAGPIMGNGEITVLDAAAGRITINHGPINGVDGAARVTEFRVEDSMILRDLEAGDQVDFQVKSIDEPNIITAITGASAPTRLRNGASREPSTRS